MVHLLVCLANSLCHYEINCLSSWEHSGSKSCGCCYHFCRRAPVHFHYHISFKVLCRHKTLFKYCWYFFSPKCLQCPPQEDEAENQLEEVNKLIENTVDEEEDLDEEFDEDEDELDEEEEEEEEDRGINELKSVG